MFLIQKAYFFVKGSIRNSLVINNLLVCIVYALLIKTFLQLKK
jgi:hypothetical protein